MIFVTVGTELPFDRLVRAVDDWAAESGAAEVFAQIGEGAWEPLNIGFSHFLEPPEFDRRFLAADLIVAHAGMGTILSALRYGKPLLVMPRRANFGEQRNDHQLATARRLSEMGKLDVAMDETELRSRLRMIDGLPRRTRIGADADSGLLSAIRDFIAESRR